jgi:hypothetical protein
MDRHMFIVKLAKLTGGSLESTNKAVAEAEKLAVGAGGVVKISLELAVKTVFFAVTPRLEYSCGTENAQEPD